MKFKSRKLLYNCWSNMLNRCHNPAAERFKNWGIVLLVLAGCMTPAQKAEKNMAKYGPACEAYGFTKGTPEFGNCVLQLRGHAVNAVGAGGSALQGTKVK